MSDRLIDARIERLGEPDAVAPARVYTTVDPPAQVQCPAGAPIAGSMAPRCGVTCRIAQEFVDLGRNPRQLLAHCLHAYELCSTWRQAKEADWAEGVDGLLDETKADAARSRDPREERE
jgi:hypothetical protein